MPKHPVARPELVSKMQARSGGINVNAPLYAGTYSARACRCCIPPSTYAICRRGRLRGPGRILCRPLVSQSDARNSKGVKCEHTEPVGFLRMHLQSRMDNLSWLLRRSRENLDGNFREAINFKILSIKWPIHPDIKVANPSRYQQLRPSPIPIVLQRSL